MEDWVDFRLAWGCWGCKQAEGEWSKPEAPRNLGDRVVVMALLGCTAVPSQTSASLGVQLPSRG